MKKVALNTNRYKKSTSRFYLFYITSILILSSCTSNTQVDSKSFKNEQDLVNSKEIQDSIIKEYLEHGAWTKGLYSMEWQQEIDKGLQKDSTIAYLWQQKAMPLFKQGKYELGMEYIDKAVQYDRRRWQDYRAFIKCIFAKTYKEAILDFKDFKARFGEGYVMDHSYDFYIGLSLIQLNRFSEAEVLLQQQVDKQFKADGEEWVHHLDLFYLGIALYEQRKLEQAIVVFDRAISLFPQFSDAIYYKANCIGRLGRKEEAKVLIEEAKKYGKSGNTITEDNVIYERYPYQVRWGNY